MIGYKNNGNFLTQDIIWKYECNNKTFHHQWNTMIVSKHYTVCHTSRNKCESTYTQSSELFCCVWIIWLCENYLIVCKLFGCVWINWLFVDYLVVRKLIDCVYISWLCVNCFLVCKLFCCTLHSKESVKLGIYNKKFSGRFSMVCRNIWNVYFLNFWLHFHLNYKNKQHISTLDNCSTHNNHQQKLLPK